tara:strand:- start:5270 stop:5896 length:627 start_codon:yes stop_codon:yes gene_type:complete
MGSFFDDLKLAKQPIYIYSFVKDTIWTFNGDIQSFSDNFTANVNSEAVYGRIDPIKTYSGTTREISFSIQMNSLTDPDYFDTLINMAACMYPVYNTNNVLINNTNILKAPPLYAVKCQPLILGNSKITEGTNTISNMLPGFFTSFGISYNTADGVEVGTRAEVPRECTLNFSFSPLHDLMGGAKEDNTSMADVDWPWPGYQLKTPPKK